MGVRVFLHRAPDSPNPLPGGGVSFGCQLFATLETGIIIMATTANGLATERVPDSITELGEMIQSGLHEPSLEPDMRTNVFGNLVAELARQDIRTDLETLMHLPFHIEVTEEVRALLAGE